MKTVVAALILALLTACVSAQWTNCGGPSDHLKITSVTFSPNPPVIGQQLTVSVSGNLDEQVTSGQAKISVLYSGSVPIFDQTVDLCSVFAPTIQCPLPAGAFTKSVSQTIPSFAPPGEYSGQITLTDQNNQEIVCVKFDLQMSSSSAVADNRLVLDDEMIATINKENHGWTAGRNKKFEGMTIAEAKKLLGTKRIARPGYVQTTSEAADAIPTSFDARQQWPNCIHPIRNQEQCGSCWAFSATEVLSDRFCIASNNNINVILSPQDLVSCDQVDQGCNGGYLNTAWDYMVNNGVVQDSCFPYTSGNGNAPACPSNNKCADGKPWTKYYAQSGSVRNPTTISAIQTAIMTSGPVQAAFDVYQDFMSYTSGVYVHKKGELLGGHAIKIVGWGVSGSTPYWIVANSWGPDWGISGFFWIKRGADECGIEDDVYYGAAKTN